MVENNLLVVVESPWAGLGAGPKAVDYLRACIRDTLSRGEIPWASHAMLAYTRALYEEDEEQRNEGIEVCKRMIFSHAQKVVFYLDHGLSEGMRKAFIWARMHGKPTEGRLIYSEYNDAVIAAIIGGKPVATTLALHKGS